MKVELLQYPTDAEWMEVKRRALVTVGKSPVTNPTEEWKKRILRARHSPIRFLQFSFYLEVPYWVSVHLIRHHVGCQAYAKSQRNDRQDEYDRNKAPQDQMVSMIWDMNAEALMTIAGKRLCHQASRETREVVREMCIAVIDNCPEFEGLLAPNCVQYGTCHEMYTCGESDNLDIWV